MGEKYKGNYIIFFYSWTFFLWIFACSTWSHASPSSGALNCWSHHWCNETPCLDAWSHSISRGKYFKQLMQPHTIMMWHGQWIESHLFFYFIHDFLHNITHLGKKKFPWGRLKLKVGCDPFFPQHWGRYHLMSKARSCWQPMVLQCYLHWAPHHWTCCYKGVNMKGLQT